MNTKHVLGSDRTAEEAKQEHEAHDFNVSAVARGIYHGITEGKGHRFTAGDRKFFISQGLSETIDKALEGVTPDFTVIEIEYLGEIEIAENETKSAFEVSKVS